MRRYLILIKITNKLNSFEASENKNIHLLTKTVDEITL